MRNNPRIKARAMVEAIDKKISTSEYRGVTMKGVRDLSRSDLLTARLYGETICESGSYEGLRTPLGKVRDLLTSYGL